MAETIEADDESWTEVIVTLAISTTTSLFFLTTYEIARRNPSLLEVFDRRRASKPHRTPPPLLRNSILEWLFLSNDPGYREYSDLAHMRDVIMEKRRQRGVNGVNGCCGWLCGRKGGGGSGGSSAEHKSGMLKPNDTLETAASGGGDVEYGMPEPNKKDTIAVSSTSFGVELSTKPTQTHHIIQTRNKKNNTSSSTSSSRRSKVSTHSSSAGSNNSSTYKKITIRKDLTPDVVEVNGWRLPKEIEDHAKAGDLTEEELHLYEYNLLQQERKDEIEFQRRRRKMTNEWFGTSSDSTDNDKNDSGGGGGGGKSNKYSGDVFLQLDDTSLEELETDVNLRLPPRRSRLWYFGFGHRQMNLNVSTNNSSSSSNGAKEDNSNSTQKKPGSASNLIGKSLTIFRQAISMNSSKKLFHSNSDRQIHDEENDDDAIHLRRHLKAVSVLEKRPLSASDKELLRCIGLDTFVMIRFLRFCFDVTFFPFIVACIILLPTYAYNNFEGDIEGDEGTVVKTQTNGYFLITINRLEPSSYKLWVCFGFTFFYLIYVLRRLWIEWETFLPLRFDFLANGDSNNDIEHHHQQKQHEPKRRRSYKSRAVVAPKDDVQLHLEQYRNSCMVEYVPDSHRRDQDLYQFFDAVFPGQVRRAEILVNATELTNMIKKRQKIIENYERTYAKYNFKKKKYLEMRGGQSENEDENGCCGRTSSCCQREPREPKNPIIKLGKGLNRKTTLALPHYIQELNNLNREIEREYKKVSNEKKIAMDVDQEDDFMRNTFDEMRKVITGEGSGLKCDTGFVEFTNITAKQSALQCNITGTNGFMVLTSAPDPRDVLWENSTVEKQIIIVKNAQCGLLLFTGTLFWFAVVGFVTSLSNIDQYREQEYLPAWMFPKEDSILYELIEGFVPVVLLELLMLVVPFTLRIIAEKFIRFKTHSEIDQFIYKWHFAYRITNLISIIVRQQILKTLDLLLKNPSSTVDYLVGSIALSSQFFLNNMIVAAGTETFLELSQLFSICKHLIMNKFVTLEATSKRDLERMQEPVSLEWGEKIPPFIFAFLVGSIYSTVVPIVMGACALYFYVAAKVYTHQALFIYAQPYEGGGKLMYLLNRSVFGIIYISICFFTAILTLKNAGIATALFFFVSMLMITYVIDRWITTKFVNPSTTLALTNARIIDEQTKARNERKRLYKEFKEDQRRQREEEANTENKYLPNSLLPPNAESESSGLKHMVRFDDEENRMNGTRRRRRRSSGNHASKSSGHSRRADDMNKDFYLYRQPQLNRALWETKPRPS